jgi:PTH1 family peptidyl-tRNA hydrolase
MKLVVGLGNPGEKYKSNRHNIGFLLLDKYGNKKNISFKKRKYYLIAQDKDIVFIKPRTFMNNSGIAVTSILSKYKVEDILVIVDDVNLPLGDIRLRQEGGFGGHNGLKSIAYALGSEEFKRLRIGVSNPSGFNISDYVLSDFSEEEEKVLKIVFDFSVSLLEIYIESDFEQVLNYYSKYKKSYSEKIKESQDR